MSSWGCFGERERERERAFVVSLFHIEISIHYLSFNDFSFSSLQTSEPEQKSIAAEDSPPLTFEDRRKMNFEAGRQELERRKKMLQEQQEKEAVSFAES